MATEVGSAFVSIVPSARGFGSSLTKQTAPAFSKVGAAAGQGITRGIDGKLRDAQGRFVSEGRRSGKGFGSGFGLGIGGKGALGAGAVLALGALVKSAVSAEAQFSQTMNTMAAVAQVPQKQIKVLSDLALKMGADTVFSAQDAANAMLELAKGGLSTAQIRAGALKETLTLAAASGVDMATAATVMSNAMNTFDLSAKDAPKITAALAGGANASTASIGSLGEALQQVGPGAKNAGLSVQETVAALAAFDNAGIKGSDAGTSLKTMLTRLIPQTSKAKGMMEDLGLSFTDANGNVLPLIKIAGRLQKALGGLNDADRTTALNRIFGSDASRAASVLSDLGDKGIRPFVKATKDQGAAQRIAAARMAGTAGAVENLKGAFDTAKVKIGQALAPAVIAGAGLATRALNGLSNHMPQIVGAFQKFGGFIRDKLIPVLGPILKSAIDGAKSAFQSIKGALTKNRGAIDSLVSGFKAVVNFIITKVLPVLGPFLKQAFIILGKSIVHIITVIANLIVGFQALGRVVVPIIVFIAKLFLSFVGLLINGAAKAFGWVPGLGGKLKGAANAFNGFKTKVTGTLDSIAQSAKGWGTKTGNNFNAGLTEALVGQGVKKSVAVGVNNKVSSLARSGGAFESGGGGGDIIVNNPLPERTSDSVDKVLRRKRHAAGWSAG